jgi:hypothetical protein
MMDVVALDIFTQHVLMPGPAVGDKDRDENDTYCTTGDFTTCAQAIK